MTKRIAVIGAGHMARVRAKALLATKKAVICGVASRTLSSAQRFGKEIGCETCLNDFRALAETSPEAVLVEVPHGVQDDAVLWALGQGLHVWQHRLTQPSGSGGSPRISASLSRQATRNATAVCGRRSKG